MILPENTTKVTITRAGEVQALRDENVDPIIIGQIELAIFPNENGLSAVRANLFKESNISGEPIILNPSESNAGEIFQGYLESSMTLSLWLLSYCVHKGGMRCVVRPFK